LQYCRLPWFLRAFPSTTLDKAVFDFKWIIYVGTGICQEFLNKHKNRRGIFCILSYWLENLTLKTEHILELMIELQEPAYCRNYGSIVIYC
jgi:hypothetical protein